LALIEKLPKTKNRVSPTVPFSIKIFKRCIDYGVSAELMKHLHLYDLQCLLIQFETQRIEEYLRSEEKRKCRRGV
jgi:hypothetical protein